MRKIIAVLLMAGVIGVYIIRMMTAGQSDTNETNQSKVMQQLEACEEMLKTQYPENPADLIAQYNALLEIGYNNTLKDQEIDKYVEVTRMFYSEAFKELNPIEKQKEAFIKDLDSNKKNGIKLVTSTVGPIYILTDKKGEETEATVTVEHAMNVSGTTREYIFVKQDNQWKINGWKSKE